MRLILIFCVLLPGIAAAGTTRAVFDIYVGGIRAGAVSISGEERGGRYAVAGRLESAGLIGAVRRVRYDAEVQGRIAGGALAPGRYGETYRRGGEVEEKSIEYAGGVPRVTPEGKKRGRLDPAAQGGTIDPLTAIWGVLRDVDEGEACRFSGEIFDGRRRSRVTLGEPEREGDGIACDGAYLRVAGYSDDDMEDPRYPFRVRYGPAGGGRWQVERIDMESIFGRGAIVRQ